MYDKVVKTAQKLDIDDFNLRIGEVWGNSLEFKDRVLEKAYSGTEIGASIRLLRKGCWGFYSANDVSEKSLLKCLDRAYRMAKLSDGHVDEKVEILPIDFTPAKGAIEAKKDLRDIHIKQKKKLTLEVTPTARNYLIDSGYDEKYGARPLRRTIQRKIEDPLANEILKGKFKQGSTVVVDFEEDNIVFKGAQQRKKKEELETVETT